MLLLLFAKMPNYSVQHCNSVLERFLDSITPKGNNDCEIQFQPLSILVKEITLCTSPTFYEDRGCKQRGSRVSPLPKAQTCIIFCRSQLYCYDCHTMELAAGEKRRRVYGNGRGGAVVTAMQRNFHRNSERNEERMSLCGN